MRRLHTDYSISLLEEKDVPGLVKLEQACFSTAWTEEQYRSFLRQDTPSPALSSQATWGMHAPDGSLVAYINVGLHTGARELEIYNIAVQESFRCQGLGKLLLLHVLEWSLQNNFEKVLLEVREGNKAALALYASTGFTLIGRRRRYYRDNGEDALVLSCNLKAQP